MVCTVSCFSDDRFPQGYERLRDSTYNQDASLADIEKYYEAAKSSVLSSIGEPKERSYWISRVEYMMARTYQVLDKKKEAATHYEAGLSAIQEAMKSGDFSEGYRMMSECISQMCLVKDTGFVLMNGLKVGEYAEKAVKLHERNVPARIILAAQKIYPPGIFGGDPAKGIELMKEILAIPAVSIEKDDLFNIYSGIGLGYSKLGKKAEAREWLGKALAIYPKNKYVNEEYQKVKN